MTEREALRIDRSQRIRHPFLEVAGGEGWLRVANADVFVWLVLLLASPTAALASLVAEWAGPEVALATWMSFAIGVYAHATRQSVALGVVVGALASAVVALAQWLAPWAGAAVFFLGWASVTVELDVRPGRARFVRRVLGVPVTWRTFGPEAAERRTPWYWDTFDGDDFVAPRRVGAGEDDIDSLISLRGRRDEALGAFLDAEVRRLLREAPHV